MLRRGPQGRGRRPVSGQRSAVSCKALLGSAGLSGAIADRQGTAAIFLVMGMLLLPAVLVGLLPAVGALRAAPENRNSEPVIRNPCHFKASWCSNHQSPFVNRHARHLPRVNPHPTLSAGLNFPSFAPPTAAAPLLFDILI